MFMVVACYHMSGVLFHQCGWAAAGENNSQMDGTVWGFKSRSSNGSQRPCDGYPDAQPS